MVRHEQALDGHTWTDTLTDEETLPTEGLQRRMRDIGTIQVYLYLIIRESRTVAPIVPRLDLSQLDPMSEKISQKCVPIRGDVLTHQIRYTLTIPPSCTTTNTNSLTEPQVMRSSEYHQTETAKAPFASYTFHYRSTRKPSAVCPIFGCIL